MQKQEIIETFINECIQNGKNEFCNTGTIDRKIMILTINDVEQTSIVCYALKPALPIPYALKMEEIADMINCFIKTTEDQDQGIEVLSAIYVEHFEGVDKDLLFFHIRTEENERREVILFEKGLLYVDEVGKINQKSDITTYVNIIK